MSDVTIYGAGQAGLVAAINLARDGYEVVVHDREPGYGGSSMYNPSAHTTPIDVDRTSEYIGIDVSSAFHPSVASLYMHDSGILWRNGLCTVERGNREGSLDTLLYGEAEKLGIEFRFNSPMTEETLDNLPENCIIACGLIPAAYEMLGIPYLRWYGYISRGYIGFSDYSWVWFDEGITEYGYLSSVNNYYFNLLFSTREISKDALKRYESFMVRCEGVEHDEWEYVSGAVPIASPDNPRLFHRGAVLAGTISGAMDPMAWFGILGALVTGKVAATAIVDPKKGEEEFHRFTRKFAAAYRFKNDIFYKIRPHVDFLERGLLATGLTRAQKMMDFVTSRRMPGAVPGFTDLMGCY